MTINERLELIRAGYTKEEISAFETGAEPEQPKPEQPKPEQPKSEQPKSEQPKSEQPKPEQPTQDNSAVLKAINDLTKAIQLQNMQKIGLETPGGMTAEEALAQGVFGNKIGGK